MVVPAYGAASTLRELVDRILAMGAERALDLEVVVVDDGSRDPTWTVIQELAGADVRVRGLRLARNTGQTSAWCAGIEAARGQIVVTIDADLDTFPEDIPMLLDAIAGGADVASGDRQGRAGLRSLTSRVFNWRTRRLGLPYRDTGCGMVAMRATVARETLAHGELRRSVRFKGLLASLTPRLVEVPVRAGKHQPSHHRLGDLVSAWFEVEIAFRRTTMLGLATLGAAGAGVGGTALLVAAAWALQGDPRATSLAAWAVVMLMLGVVLATVSVAANLVLRSLGTIGVPFAQVVETTPTAPGGPPRPAIAPDGP